MRDESTSGELEDEIGMREALIDRLELLGEDEVRLRQRDIENLFDDRDAMVRYHAVVTIGRAGLGSVERLLARLDVETNDLVICELLEQLADLEDARAAPPAKQFLATHPYHLVRQSAAMCFGEVLEKDAKEYLLRRLREDQSARVRAVIGCVLTWLGVVEGFEYVCRALRFKDPRARAPIAGLLNFYDVGEFRPELCQAVLDAVEREECKGTQADLEKAARALCGDAPLRKLRPRALERGAG